jgi:hypothetical protein
MKAMLLLDNVTVGMLEHAYLSNRICNQHCHLMTSTRETLEAGAFESYQRVVICFFPVRISMR